MSTLKIAPRLRDGAHEGVVARMSAGGWSFYHREDCPDAPARGADGVRNVMHGPWRYLASHWHPCPVCNPPYPVMTRRPRSARAA